MASIDIRKKYSLLKENTSMIRRAYILSFAYNCMSKVVQPNKAFLNQFSTDLKKISGLEGEIITYIQNQRDDISPSKVQKIVEKYELKFEEWQENCELVLESLRTKL